MILVFARMPGESYRRGCTSGEVYVPCIYTYSHVRVTAEDVALVEFMYRVLTRIAR